jgi:carbonic anhydrase
MTGRADKSIVVPAEAIARLKDGNSRYAIERRAELAKSQHPFAIVVSCSDSRVSPEIVFDQALGGSVHMPRGRECDQR